MSNQSVFRRSRLLYLLSSTADQAISCACHSTLRLKTSSGSGGVCCYYGFELVAPGRGVTAARGDAVYSQTSHGDTADRRDARGHRFPSRYSLHVILLLSETVAAVELGGGGAHDVRWK